MFHIRLNSRYFMYKPLGWTFNRSGVSARFLRMLSAETHPVTHSYKSVVFFEPLLKKKKKKWDLYYVISWLKASRFLFLFLFECFIIIWACLFLSVNNVVNTARANNCFTVFIILFLFCPPFISPQFCDPISTPQARNWKYWENSKSRCCECFSF